MSIGLVIRAPASMEHVEPLERLEVTILYQTHGAIDKD